MNTRRRFAERVEAGVVARMMEALAPVERLDRRFVRLDRRFTRLPKRLVLLIAANCGIFPDSMISACRGASASLAGRGRVVRCSTNEQGRMRRSGLKRAIYSRREAMQSVMKRSTGGALGPAVLVLAGGLAAGAASDAGATNLVVNGGFESGNTGFTSNYTYTTAWTAGLSDWRNWVDAGEYTVWSDAAQVHGIFTGSPESGTEFFIANGSSNTTQAVWQSQAFNVTQVGVSYRFEAYVSSLVPPVFNGTPLAPPSLVFEISSDGGSNWTGLGSTVDLTGAPAGAWYLSYADTTLNTAGSYLIRLRNNQGAADGNDFGLDSIYFGLAAVAPSAVPGAGIAGVATLGLAGLARRRRR